MADGQDMTGPAKTETSRPGPGTGRWRADAASKASASGAHNRLNRRLCRNPNCGDRIAIVSAK